MNCVDCEFEVCACEMLDSGFTYDEAAQIVAFFIANPDADNEVTFGDFPDAAYENFAAQCGEEW